MGRRKGMHVQREHRLWIANKEIEASKGDTCSINEQECLLNIYLVIWNSGPHSVLFRVNSGVCVQGSLLAGLGMLGIKPRLTVFKESTLSTVISLCPPCHFSLLRIFQFRLQMWLSDIMLAWHLWSTGWSQSLAPKRKLLRIEPFWSFIYLFACWVTPIMPRGHPHDRV